MIIPSIGPWLMFFQIFPFILKNAMSITDHFEIEWSKTMISKTIGKVRPRDNI